LFINTPECSPRQPGELKLLKASSCRRASSPKPLVAAVSSPTPLLAASWPKSPAGPPPPIPWPPCCCSRFFCLRCEICCLPIACACCSFFLCCLQFVISAARFECCLSFDLGFGFLCLLFACGVGCFAAMFVYCMWSLLFCGCCFLFACVACSIVY
jgi:hypothetical protein